MNTVINIKGKKLKVVRFTDPLFRADKTSFTVGQRASNNYRGAPMKYFTLNRNELKAYTKYNMPHMKKWMPQEELILINILDLPTRNALSELIGEKSLSIAFPIKGNKVSRISEEDTKEHDNIVLQAICDLSPRLDGYYMRKLTTQGGEYIFHSEVGLCPRAFSKLVLENVSRNAYQPPPVPKRNTRRNTKRNNNNTQKKRPRFVPLSFNLNNNSNNTKNKKNNTKTNTTNNNLPLSRALF